MKHLKAAYAAVGFLVILSLVAAKSKKDDKPARDSSNASIRTQQRTADAFGKSRDKFPTTSKSVFDDDDDYLDSDKARPTTRPSSADDEEDLDAKPSPRSAKDKQTSKAKKTTKAVAPKKEVVKPMSKSKRSEKAAPTSQPTTEPSETPAPPSPRRRK